MVKSRVSLVLLSNEGRVGNVGGGRDVVAPRGPVREVRVSVGWRVGPG